MCERIKLHVWSLKCLIGNTLCTHQCCYGIMESLRCARVYFVCIVRCEFECVIFRLLRAISFDSLLPVVLMVFDYFSCGYLQSPMCWNPCCVCACVLCCAMLYCIPCALIKLIIKFLLLLLLFIKMIMSIFAFLFHTFFPLVYSFDIYAGSCTIYG